MQLTWNKYILKYIYCIKEEQHQIFKITRLARVRFDFQTPEIQTTNYINLSGGEHSEWCTERAMNIQIPPT